MDKKIRIRTIQTSDAKKFLNMQIQLDQETEYMLLKPEERNQSLIETEKMIADVLAENNLFLIALSDDQKLLGYLSAERSGYKKIKHVAYIVIGILIEGRSQGIGTRFFNLLDIWAKENRIVRLELTVMTRNQPAITLYKKAGFVIEGTRKKAIFQDNHFFDEYYMAKIFQQPDIHVKK